MLLPSFEPDADGKGASLVDDGYYDMAESGIAHDENSNLCRLLLPWCPMPIHRLIHRKLQLTGLSFVLLGGSSALIASPYAIPVFTSILAYLATSCDPILGAILLVT